MPARQPDLGAGPAAAASAEARFLAGVLRSAVEPEAPLGVAEWEGADLCWEQVLRLARRHCVVPLLQRALGAGDGWRRPELRQRLARHCAANRLRNRSLALLMAEIRSLFAARGIPVAPLKGPLLAQELYGDAGLRECHDLDLLVPDDCLVQAGAALRSDRWSPLWHDGEALAFTRPAAAVPVELHSQVCPRSFARPLVDSGVWERMGAATLEGIEFPVIAPDDLLLLLCVHGAKHHWTRLDWVLDVHVLAGRLSPEQLLALEQRARGHGAARMLRTGLLLSRDLFSTPLPSEAVSGAAADRTASSLAGQARDYLLSGREEEPHALTIHRYRLRMQEGAADRARYAAHAASAIARAILRPNRRDREWVRLPRRWSGLYLLLRPFRLLARRLPSPAGRRIKQLPREP